MKMTAKKSSAILEACFWLFAIAVPLLVTFLFYMSLETTTSNMSLNIIGVFVVLGIVLGALKLVKKRMKTRKDNGFPVSKYLSTAIANLPWLAGTVLATWFFFAIKDEITKLSTVMVIISISEAVAFGLSIWQVHFDKQITA